MLDFATCAGTVSLLPALEPLAGASLAINLAYLNLDRFRYRAKIRDHAKKALDSVTDKNEREPLPPEITGTNLYKRILRLAQLPDNDPMGTHDGPTEKGPNGKSVSMPDGFWGKVYTKVFEYHADRWTSVVLTGVSLFALVFGAAHSIGHLTFFNCLVAGPFGALWFYMLSAGVLAPIACIWISRFVVAWACNVVTESIGDMAGIMQGAARQARLNLDGNGQPQRTA